MADDAEDTDVATGGSIAGHRICLSEGREVFVGRNVDPSDTTIYIRFINAQAEESRFRISPEAAEALSQLLDPTRTPEVLMRMMIDINTTTGEKVWKQVSPDENAHG